MTTPRGILTVIREGGFVALVALTATLMFLVVLPSITAVDVEDRVYAYSACLSLTSVMVLLSIGLLGRLAPIGLVAACTLFQTGSLSVYSGVFGGSVGAGLIPGVIGALVASKRGKVDAGLSLATVLTMGITALLTLPQLIRLEQSAAHFTTMYCGGVAFSGLLVAVVAAFSAAKKARAATLHWGLALAICAAVAVVVTLVNVAAVELVRTTRSGVLIWGLGFVIAALAALVGLSAAKADSRAAAQASFWRLFALAVVLFAVVGPVLVLLPEGP